MANAATSTATKTEPTPESPVIAERSARQKADDTLRKAARPLLDAFQAPELGLDRYAASILAAHVHSTMPEAEAMDRKELVEWGLEFKRLHPILWQSIKNKNLMGVSSQLKRHRIDAAFAKDYANMATVIRS